jgi:uncharacterized protein
VLAKPIGPLCNLRCEHCFYLDKVSLYPRDENFRMPDPVLERYVRERIESRPAGARQVEFAWQGGEPTLMGLDFFRRALDLQRRFAPHGVDIHNALQTNGTRLDDEWARFLRDEGFLVGISIDGPPELHDRYRVDERGKGSHQPALRGLEALVRNGVEFNTLTCIQAHNGDSGERIFDYLKSIGSRYMQFIPVVERAEGGGVSPRSVAGRQFGSFMNAIFDRWLERDVGEVFVQHFDMMLGLVLGMPSSLCVHSAECGRCLAMEHNGDVFSCDHFVTPEHRIGNLMQTTLAELADSEQALRFGAAKSNTLPRDCRECRYRRYCHGGCPADRTDRTAAGEPGLNRLCEGYKLFYAHTLPVFEAMGRALRADRQAFEWREFASARAGYSEGAPKNSA